ncbi:hypothetical protein PRZ48_007888 [Zasmidium cellare]|uniref:AMP-dependent synthetase/ligase domain-containing protein n=1 Tax=Zasmidium cellare TaxID=395010 RepID=A0ABR0EKR1_ZASCE|nr:hypothetical protein PRZ48_007888 [Zasmidium cellare]
MLATTSLGGIWTAVSPDTGTTAIKDRLSQVEPSVLFTDNAVSYNGKSHVVLSKVNNVSQSLESLKAVVVFPAVGDLPPKLPGSAIDYDDFLAWGEDSHQLYFEQLPAEQPVYILYSSGTTGAPKCIVHGAIGTLLQHKKEHMLQSDIRPGDRLFYYTTCMWMMWHWHVSALASGVTLVIYDGSPFYAKHNDTAVEDYLAMPKLIDELKITHFGTSAKFLSVLQQREIKPKKAGISLETLKAVYSTGSPLAPATFRYVYDTLGPNIHLGSISGGTDIIADFGTPSTLNPVHAGEIQVPALGMAVQAWTPDGVNVSESGQAGELVCVKPFPSQPVRFWGPSGLQKYEKAYFERFPGYWHHGDFIKFNPKTGGIYMLGRSDGTLNPSGVRFGSAEIYNVLLSNFSDLIEDSLCVGRRREKDTDETVILFIKMRTGNELTPSLVGHIKKVIREHLSPRHVPRIIEECPDIPYTRNNKKVELAVKQIVSGLETKPSASIANAECLTWYQEWTEKN